MVSQSQKRGSCVMISVKRAYVLPTTSITARSSANVHPSELGQSRTGWAATILWSLELGPADWITGPHAGVWGPKWP